MNPLHVRCRFEALGRLLRLPAGVQVVAVRQAGQDTVEFTLIDPDGRMSEGTVFDWGQWQWGPGPSSEVLR